MDKPIELIRNRSIEMSHPAKYLSDDDLTVVLELARYALADGETYDMFAEKLDLSDCYLKGLQIRLEEVTEGV